MEEQAAEWLRMLHARKLHASISKTGTITANLLTQLLWPTGLPLEQMCGNAWCTRPLKTRVWNPFFYARPRGSGIKSSSPWDTLQFTSCTLPRQLHGSHACGAIAAPRAAAPLRPFGWITLAAAGRFSGVRLAPAARPPGLSCPNPGVRTGGLALGRCCPCTPAAAPARRGEAPVAKPRLPACSGVRAGGVVPACQNCMLLYGPSQQQRALCALWDSTLASTE